MESFGAKRKMQSEQNEMMVFGNKGAVKRSFSCTQYRSTEKTFYCQCEVLLYLVLINVYQQRLQITLAITWITNC